MTETAQDEMAAIRKALAPDLYEQPEESIEEKSAGDEVYYNEGASPLFMAIENGKWESALEIVEDSPEQVKLWVLSTGTVETTFNWSLWRRLPLHEACRRQAPAWLVAALISAHPLSAREPTQFGELPLHLAVECGASPSVVNLLLVSHWVGVVTTDRSGRTPLEILNENEMLDREDHEIVVDSLRRGRICFEELKAKHNEQVLQIKETHASGIEAIHHQHSADLALEQETQDKLLGEIERLKALLVAGSNSEAVKDREIEKLLSHQEAQSNKIAELEQKILQVTKEKDAEIRKVEKLEAIVREKDNRIKATQKRSSDLEGDLQAITAWHEEELRRSLERAQRHARKMVESFSTLSTHIEDHSGNLKTLLAARGIDAQPRSPNKQKEEEKEPRDPNVQQEFVLDDDAVRAAAAAAASSVLKV